LNGLAACEEVEVGLSQGGRVLQRDVVAGRGDDGAAAVAGHVRELFGYFVPEIGLRADGQDRAADRVGVVRAVLFGVDPEGVFVLECRIPTAPARPGHQFVDPEHITADHVTLGVAWYDPVTQILDLNHVRISSDGIILSPISLRLAHPPEFDLMARVAGLRLRERWGGWTGEPYTAASWRHISVYEPAGPPVA
jgi:hypothetical protein